MENSVSISVSRETYDRLDVQAKIRGLGLKEYLDYLGQNVLDERERERTFFEKLKADGLIVTWPPDPTSRVPSDFKPVPAKGKLASEIIVEDRDSR